MLEVAHISKSFDGVTAVNDVSFTAGRGETVVLMGPSGCGKSTTVRMINRLVKPDKGRISFAGCEIGSLSEASLNKLRQQIGYVFQQFNLIKRLTVLENVMFAPVLNGRAASEAEAAARRALVRVGLSGLEQKKAADLSGGQQQRVAIARALALEPQLILWDEPTASLDPILVREVLSIMEELARVHEMTMLVVTHELSFALNVADRLILMEQGRIMESGPPEEVFARPVSAVGRLYQELLQYQIAAGKRIFH